MNEINMLPFVFHTQGSTHLIKSITYRFGACVQGSSYPTKLNKINAATLATLDVSFPIRKVFYYREAAAGRIWASYTYGYRELPSLFKVARVAVIYPIDFIQFVKNSATHCYPALPFIIYNLLILFKSVFLSTVAGCRQHRFTMCKFSRVMQGALL